MGERGWGKWREMGGRVKGGRQGVGLRAGKWG